MALNHVQKGGSLTFTNSGATDIASGAPVVVGDKVGVALVAIPAGSSGEVAMDEVFSLAKGAEEILQGKKVYLIASNSTITGTAGSNVLAGYAHAHAATADGTVDVNLNR